MWNSRHGRWNVEEKLATNATNNVQLWILAEACALQSSFALQCYHPFPLAATICTVYTSLVPLYP